MRYHIQLRGPAVRHCYVRELGKHPNWKTSVTVELSIDPTGRVTECKLGETSIEQCVARAVCTIRFPYVFDTLSNGQTQVSSLTTQVRYRFRFQPRSRERHAGLDKPPSAETRADDGQPAGSQPAASLPVPPRPTPASNPAPGGAIPPPPSKRKHTLPRIRVQKSNDPLEGLDRANPL